MRRLIPVTAIAALAICVAGPGPSSASPTTATAPAPAPIDRDKSSCATTMEDQRQNTSAKYEITSGGIERTYILRLPRGYERRGSWPVIVAFHGRGSSGTEMEGYSKLSQLPAIVAYPDGVIGTGSGYRKAWQGAPYEAPGVDDVAFVDDLLDHLQTNLCTDPRRTYAVGKSNGGGMAALLGCQFPNRFAAVGTVAGALYPGAREGCHQAPGVPLIAVHGTGDATIPYDGDAERDLPAIRDWAGEWAERNGCTDSTRTRRASREVVIEDWRRCDRSTPVRHVAVKDGGHVWPGADVYSGGGYVTQTIENHRVLWKFFSQQRLPKEPRR